MAQPAVQASAPRFWGALFVACLLSGFMLLLCWVFFIPFAVGPTGMRVIGALIAFGFIMGMQRSLVHAFTHWRPSYLEIVFSALPGLAVGIVLMLDVIGFAPQAAALPGCLVQALVLRLIAPAAIAGNPMHGRRGLTAPVLPPVMSSPIPEPVPDMGLVADMSNPAAPAPRPGPED